MDILSIVFYALVCGLLSVFAPNLGKPSIRMTIGALVGVIAASLLPILRDLV